MHISRTPQRMVDFIHANEANLRATHGDGSNNGAYHQQALIVANASVSDTPHTKSIIRMSGQVTSGKTFLPISAFEK
ncbi:hypothetical protein CEXT_240851 [Caerostris extrusa]|uniref:Uncharacterized protein n=1 Tax=Caerostris extrusa TaxID=172846 RepID=A0AAV4XHA7_CAEEX|nr:hypothetical protein CEXT_240851 [Caerostris extrusa]